MNNDNFMVFVYNAIIALFAFFVAAPMLLNAISLFTVQKRFAKVMVDEGVVKEETVRRLHPKKQVARRRWGRPDLPAGAGRSGLDLHTGGYGLYLRLYRSGGGRAEVPEYHPVQQPYRPALPQYLQG